MPVSPNNRAEAFAAFVVSMLNLLEPERRDLFLNWLRIHCGLAVHGVDRKSLRDSLNSWFGSLSMPALVQEYRLILEEILWWYELDASDLDAIKARSLIQRKVCL